MSMQSTFCSCNANALHVCLFYRAKICKPGQSSSQPQPHACRVTHTTGRDCSNTSLPARPLLNGRAPTACRTPTAADATCWPPRGNDTVPRFEHASGWTQDGRTFDDISSQLNLNSTMVPAVAPCLPPVVGAQPTSNTTAVGNGTVSPVNSTSSNGTTATQQMLLLPGYGCSLINGSGGASEWRVTLLNLTQLVAAGRIPQDKLALAPAIANLLQLSVLHAEGHPMTPSAYQ